MATRSMSAWSKASVSAGRSRTGTQSMDWMPLPRTSSTSSRADQRDVGDRDDAAARIAAGVAEGAELFEVPVARVEAGLGLQRAAGGGVEGLFGADQHAGQGELVAEGRLVAADEQDLPAVLDSGAGRRVKTTTSTATTALGCAGSTPSDSNPSEHIVAH